MFDLPQVRLIDGSSVDGEGGRGGWGWLCFIIYGGKMNNISQLYFYCLLIIVASTLQQANGYEGTAFKQCSNNHCIWRPPTVSKEMLCSPDPGFINYTGLIIRMHKSCYDGCLESVSGVIIYACLNISRYKVIKSDIKWNQQSVVWLECVITAGEHLRYWNCHCYWENWFSDACFVIIFATCVIYCQYQFGCLWLIWM